MTLEWVYSIWIVMKQSPGYFWEKAGREEKRIFSKLKDVLSMENLYGIPLCIHKIKTFKKKA